WFTDDRRDRALVGMGDHEETKRVIKLVVQLGFGELATRVAESSLGVSEVREPEFCDPCRAVVAVTDGRSHRSLAPALELIPVCTRADAYVCSDCRGVFVVDVLERYFGT